jgi:hypothetical protein
MIESKITIQREQQLDIFAFLKKDLLEQLQRQLAVRVWDTY